ncbi:16S rRNA (guanine(527)-N(7))-methyltransferase RsmG [Aurantibacillus circumpalustris]|uniref:16S rRNA (guanine(527)-N(7))-methyltransferase RsmG n=1 Tax=Aurantibacillus circumpalustris TaxID=3036359 RepID=UPI00295AA497|nr:16S rRNA (guanine(527)-N(7))-methyltransferase RsmG [Aurantibacillus circumpalustris]
MISIIQKYFKELSIEQLKQFEQLFDLYSFWNNQINVISRKDIDLLYERHILHSLGIAKIMSFKPNTQVLDVGTGGGFPGIPLAILFPETQFTLVDSIGKKIKVVNEVSSALNLKNVKAYHKRAEELDQKFHFVVSRAVTEFPVFHSWVKNKFLKENFNDLKNGILYLKGGDLKEEFGRFFNQSKFHDLKDFFEEEFFETKKVVYFRM